MKKHQKFAKITNVFLAVFVFSAAVLGFAVPGRVLADSTPQQACAAAGYAYKDTYDSKNAYCGGCTLDAGHCYYYAVGLADTTKKFQIPQAGSDTFNSIGLYICTASGGLTFIDEAAVNTDTGLKISGIHCQKCVQDGHGPDLLNCSGDKYFDLAGLAASVNIASSPSGSSCPTTQEGTDQICAPSSTTTCNGNLNADPGDSSSCNLFNYINVAINLLSISIGVVVTIMIIIGGIQYSAAGGDPQKVAKAKNRIFNAVFALIAFGVLYALTQWLVPGGILN